MNSILAAYQDILWAIVFLSLLLYILLLVVGQ